MRKKWCWWMEICNLFRVVPRRAIPRLQPRQTRLNPKNLTFNALTVGTCSTTLYGRKERLIAPNATRSSTTRSCMPTSSIQFGRTDAEIKYAKPRTPRTDILFRQKNKKVYLCAKCSEPLTVFEHMKFLFMCRKCAQDGEAHYEQWGKKVYLTNRGM